MAYYPFKCARADVREISKLCAKLGMRRNPSTSEELQYEGEYKDKIHLLTINPHAEFPLLVQTAPGVDYKSPEIAGFLLDVYVKAHATGIFEGYADPKPLSISKLQ